MHNANNIIRIILLRDVRDAFQFTYCNRVFGNFNQSYFYKEKFLKRNLKRYSVFSYNVMLFIDDASLIYLKLEFYLLLFEK